MKELTRWNCSRRVFANNHRLNRVRSFVGTLAVGTVIVSGQALHAQAPALAWSTNVGASVFAVDGQTNVYANANGTVITLNSSGVPIQTNSICPVASIVPGLAQRDSSGNFYFAGNFDGTNDFGGTNLIGGWINGFNYHPPKWVAGYPTCFLAKYGPNGALLWATSFGQQAASNHLSDLVLNVDNSLTVGLDQGAASAQIAQFSPAGASLWQTGVPGGTLSFGPVKVSALVGTNGGFLEYRTESQQVVAGTFNTSGGVAFIPIPSALNYSSALSPNGKPAINIGNELYLAGVVQPGSLPLLEKLAFGGGIVWTQAIGSVEQWLLGNDAGDNLYLSGTDSSVSKYNSSGIQIWNANYGSAAVALVIDSNGNRFLQLANGSVARMAADPAPVGPFITKPPTSATVFLGDSFNFSVTVDGTPPFYYAWQFNGTNLPAANTAALSFNAVGLSNAGPYTVVVTNAANTVTSSPAAVLRVKSVELYSGSQLLTNGTYAFTAPPTLTVRSAFPSGSAFYTLDGSAPNLGSIHYVNPFVVTQSVTVRAIGYSADFSQSEEADPVNVVLLPLHNLTASSSGGGWVDLIGPSNPPPADAVSLWKAENNMLDSAGTNNGTAEGSLAYAAGQVGQAFSLNGTDADVSIPASSTLDVGSTNGLTITTWFKPNSVTTPASLVEWFDPSFSLSHYEGVTFTINIPSNYGGTGSACLVGNLQDTSGNFHLITTPAGQFTAGTFYHAALTYDKTSGLATLYLNGTVAAQTNLGIFTPETRASNFHVVLGGVHFPIGGHIAEHFAGLMDETAIYRRALTATEVSSLYAAGGGIVTNSPTGRYWSTNMVTVAAVPAPGWQFLNWLGDASGSNATIQISTDRDKSIYAVFGTTLSTTVVGPGHVVLDPSGGLYAYGTTVELNAIPDAGSFFASWGNAAAGSSVNPLYFTVTSPTQTVSSAFASVPSGQAALTLSTTGKGTVAANPQENAFTLGQSVTLTATPADGQTFLNWSGDASGTQNPLSITMDQSKYITANFSGTPEFHISHEQGEGLGSAGFRFTVAGGAGTVYRLFCSTNMISWQSMGYVTNDGSGEIQVLDTNASSSMPRFYRIAP